MRGVPFQLGLQEDLQKKLKNELKNEFKKKGKKKPLSPRPVLLIDSSTSLEIKGSPGFT